MKTKIEIIVVILGLSTRGNYSIRINEILEQRKQGNLDLVEANKEFKERKTHIPTTRESCDYVFWKKARIERIRNLILSFRQNFALILLSNYAL